MEGLPRHGYLDFLPDSLEVVRRDVNLDKPGEIRDAVRILDEWVKQQKHYMKKDIHPVYLETLILMSKGSLERAKSVLEKMFTVRALYPHYFELFDVQKEFQLIKESSYILPLPKMIEDYYRIMVWKFIGKFSNPKIMESVYKNIFLSLEYLKRYDYHTGAVLVYDLSECDLKDALTGVNLMELKNCYNIVFESYGFRVKRIHLITASQIVYTFINFFRHFLKKKIFDRLTVHKSIDELHQFYPKHIMPKDYGGTERSLRELQDDFLSHLSSEDFSAYMKDMADAKIDESQRVVVHNDELNGTFRTLAID
ncbi:alpha-tocopherol transfer protein-like [Aricia agestis]|uniref:alpha-tocopherol transfer protein-like n=1 Tax=Aricia agestis TaxID=91739 RepID=UPI001C206CC5|nr:alpha-tocopherol transfer protein-like [Aricia agestis]